jgi:CheY-like chemotaxis protein
MMPRMNGYEARAALNDNGNPPIPVIAITASLVSREEITSRGFVDLLRKPVRSQDVVATIRRHTA